MSMTQSNFNGMQRYQLYQKNMIPNCMMQSNDNAMQHYPLCYENMIQRECKSANCEQNIAIETIQEMYATVPKHFYRCDQLYYMIMQTKQCAEAESPSPTYPPHPIQVPPPPHPRSCPCPCPCPCPGVWAKPIPHSICFLYLCRPFLKGMFLSLHDTNTRMDKNQRHSREMICP